MDEKITRLVRRSDYLFSTIERSNAILLWDEISEFMMNNQSGSFRKNFGSSVDAFNTIDSSPGSKRTRRLYDSTALEANRDLASAIQGILINPATRWSQLAFKEDDLNNDEEAINWLSKSTYMVHDYFNESNFNTEASKALLSYTSIGNMALFQEESYDEFTNEFDGYNFTAIHMSKIAWSSGRKGNVDTIFRKIDLTAEQAYFRWNKEVHENILKCLEKNPDEEFSFLHCIYPRDQKDIKLDAAGLAPGKNRPIASVYIDLTNNIIVEEEGYYEMPIFAVRFSLAPYEDYGRGPGHLALPDVRTLNKAKMRGLQSMDLKVLPPLFANQRDIFGQLNLYPGGISIVKNINGIREFVSQGRTDVLDFNIQELRSSIKGIFYLDKLLLPPRTETGEMTAYEVSQRIEQMYRVLGPTLYRLNNEFLKPLILRSFKILLRAGVLPEVPAIIRERGLDVEITFINQLSRSQQIQDISAVQQWVQMLAMMAQFNPEALDLVNVDGAGKAAAKVLGVPQGAIQNEDVVVSIRQQRQQAQQQAMQMETMTRGADVASKLQASGAGI